MGLSITGRRETDEVGVEDGQTVTPQTRGEGEEGVRTVTGVEGVCNGLGRGMREIRILEIERGNGY